MKNIILTIFCAVVFASQASANTANTATNEISLVGKNPQTSASNANTATSEIRQTSAINHASKSQSELVQIVEQYISNYKLLKTDPQTDIKHEQVILKAKFISAISTVKPSKDGFYSALHKVYKAYIDGKKEQELKDIIDAYIASIGGATDDETQAKKELISYLRANIDVFSTSMLDQTLSASTSYIDSHLPDYLQGYGIGTLLICAVFLCAVYFLRKVLISLLKWLISFVYHDKERLEHIFLQINKPLLIFISIYAVFICVRFYFYPSPVPIIVAKVFGIGFSISVAYLSIAVLDSWGVVLASKLIKQKNSQDIINLLLKVVDCLVVLVALLAILRIVGFDVSAILASLGIGGLALALAAKDIIANFFASILLAFDDSFSQGDWVIIGGVEGIVVQTGLRKTSIRTFDNTLVFLPNASVLGGNIQNFSKRKFGRKMVITIGLTYDTTKEQLERFVKAATKLVHEDPLIAHVSDEGYQQAKFTSKQKFVSLNDLEGYRASIYVWVDDFAASSINVKLYFYTKTVSADEYYKAKSELMIKLMALVQSHKLGFAFPSQSLYIEKLPRKDI